MWIKLNGHPCWKVQKALDEQGIEYVVVPGQWPGRKKRTALVEGTGQAPGQFHESPLAGRQASCLSMGQVLDAAERHRRGRGLPGDLFLSRPGPELGPGIPAGLACFAAQRNVVSD